MSLTCFTAETIECGLRMAAVRFADPNMNQSLSQPLNKWSLLTPHEAPELAKLQAVSYVEVR